ncbi:MAG: peptidoglycan DD-metalloendopeptidase family protein [Candidatus Daviesbacteria bacterium]|nr:peptidoglycan DD-metalloendopeptidase family protein [Candidatus Daviesbacteria bacterium]
MFSWTVILKVAGIILLGVCLFFAWRFFIRFLPIFPHERIIISLPFEKVDDDLIFINPMGETDHHTPPRGHPGLDFGWHHPAPLRAAASGQVTKIEEHPPGGHGETEKIYDVEVVSGVYAIRYEEMAPNSDLKVGTKVDKGDEIGRGGKYEQQGGLGVYYSTHWEFDYDTFWIDRLCPLTYFDEESFQRINKIWDSVGQTYDGQFPDICSGFYSGRDKYSF